MANYGPANIAISFDDSGGTLRVITPFILSINDIAVEAALEETQAFGKSWRESLATGIRFMADIVMGGLFDDTTVTGPDVVFKGVASAPSTATRTFTIGYGAALTTTVETVLFKYVRKPDRNGLTKFEASARPTGAVTEV